MNIVCVFVVVGILALFNTPYSAAQQATFTKLYDSSGNGLYENTFIQGSDGNFYGTTFYGGSYGNGIVFKFTPAGVFTTLVNFAHANGTNPNGIVEGIDGNFYGTTVAGGVNGSGVLYAVTPNGLTTLYSFEQPATSGLLQMNDGSFYGSTCSNAFQYKLGKNTIKYWTGGASSPRAPAPIVAQDGNIFGITWWGDLGGSNTLYEIDTSGTFTTIHNYSQTGAATALVQGLDGYLYVAHYGGGIYGDGEIFRLSTSYPHSFSRLFSFKSNDPNGSGPTTLIQGKDGNFYGTTASGTIFKITSSGTLTTLYTFSSTDGAEPTQLIQGKDDNFYGTTWFGGANDKGTIFKLSVPCDMSIWPTNSNFDASGGQGGVRILTFTNCAWTVTNNCNFVTILSDTNGSGATTVFLNVDSNVMNCTGRTGIVAIAGQTFTVMQAAGTGYIISPTNGMHSAASELGSFAVLTTGCGKSWVASNTVSWIHTSSQGSGTGTVTYVIEDNMANCVARTGTVVVASNVFTVIQGAGPGSYAITPTNRIHSARSGSGSVRVTAGIGCAWTASSSNTNWLNITGVTNGTANGFSYYSVQPNSNAISRTETLTIAGQAFTVTQDANVAPQIVISPVAPPTFPQTASLLATVTDDGSPNGIVIVTWSKLSGPGDVSFGNANTGYTTAAFSTNGTYALQLVASDGALSTTNTVTVIVNGRPVITNPPNVLNVAGTVNGTPVVQTGGTNIFSMGASDPDGNPLSCLWIFGDGSTNTDCNPSHVFTNCGPVEVTASVSDGIVTTSTGLVVSVACPFTELPKPTKLQLKSNFVPGKVDQATLKATFELPPPPFSRTNVWATVDIGGVSLDFWINAKGIGTNGLNKVTLKANAKTGLATLQVKLKGDFESAWAEHGLTNGTVISQPVTVPVLLMFDSNPVESFYVNKGLLYKATIGKSGSAK
jgi:uncharacterized repeat protein (TIGR03803 family)